MTDYKKYESFKIPDRQQVLGGRTTKTLLQTKKDKQNPLSESLFYEIDYDSFPIEGVGKFVLKSQKIETPDKDEIHELFNRMKNIARQYHSTVINYSRFFDRRVQRDKAKVFYKQAIFMKDFEDDYPEQVPFSSYFPYYQMLNYEQLRTYFTWRTQVRKGVVKNISLSYVFLYIYELLNNIGVESPQDGLDKLLSFWNSFKEYDSSIDKYFIRWLKDYHIYYNLWQEFKYFAEENNIIEHYSKIADSEDSFDLFCAISKYNIRKSIFFTDETSKLINDCFKFVIDKIRQDFEVAGIKFDDALFRPTKKRIAWKPFKDALFYQWYKQQDRRVVISENEIYICNNNEWTFSTILTTEKGRQFIGYVMKRMESVLRRITKFKFKITANINMLNLETLRKLKKSGLFIDNIVKDAVIEFYMEETKTVVTVNHTSLERIRKEAFATQESLIVEKQTEAIFFTPVQNIFEDSTNSWESLKEALSEKELQSLAIILQGESIKKFADNNNIMIEVLADGINEKAMDYFGDNILDDELVIYEDYEEQVKGMVE